MKQISFNACDLLTGHTVAPLVGATNWANLEFKAKSQAAAKIGGCGLYCASYKGQAIYVGKFLGTEANPFGGDLQKIRWERHIPSLTMRGQRVSLGKSVLAKLIQENSASPLASDLAQADQTLLTKYRGYHASYNRVQFAVRHWEALQAEPEVFLPDFDFGYVQFERQDLEGRSNTAIWKLVSNAEDLARQQLHLCCNGESNFEASIAEAPQSLEQVLERLYTNMDRLRGEEPARTHTTQAISLSTVEAGAMDRKAIVPEHQQFDAAMEQLEESLPTGWRTEWLERLRLAFQGGAVEVHATETRKHGDVRVRGLDLKRQRNLFTMAWRPSDGRFSCRILINEDQVADCPGVEMQSSSRTDPLPTGFIFDASQDQETSINGLLRLIEQAHQQAKASGL
jgi:hypothetical protein